MAREAVANQKSLAAMGIDTTEIIPARSEGEWVEALKTSYTTMWVENAALLVLGTVGAWRAWSGRRWWIVFVLGTSSWVILFNLPAMLSHTVDAGGLGPWLDLWSKILAKQRAAHELTPARLFMLYHMLIWPLLHVALALAALLLFLIELRGRPTNTEAPV